MCAGLFYKLKTQGVECEMAREWAKDAVWEGRHSVLGPEHQAYIFGKQLKRLKDLVGKVEVVVTDAPLLLSLVYGANESPAFKAFVEEQNDRFDNLDVRVRSVRQFSPVGRVQQTAEESDAIGALMDEVLEGRQFLTVDGDPSGLRLLTRKVLDARNIALA